MRNQRIASRSRDLNPEHVRLQDADISCLEDAVQRFTSSLGARRSGSASHVASKQNSGPRRGHMDVPLISGSNEQLAKQLAEASSNPLREHRERLPAFACRDTIISTIREHQVVVISGETGCGKSLYLADYRT